MRSNAISKTSVVKVTITVEGPNKALIHDFGRRNIRTQPLGIDVLRAMKGEETAYFEAYLRQDRWELMRRTGDMRW